MPDTKGLPVARFLMVLSSISPLFVLWAIRGTPIIADYWFLIFCIGMVVFPNLFLWWRIDKSKRSNDKAEITIGTYDDHRDHVLVYLFAMLLPFYTVGMDNYRDFAAHIVAIGFIVFLFWHLNMHYMNIFWAAFGFKVYTLNPINDGNQFSGKCPRVLITKRDHLNEGEVLTAHRLSNSVFLEA